MEKNANFNEKIRKFVVTEFVKTFDEFVIGDENRQRCLLKFATVAIYSQRPKTSKITNVPGWTQVNVKILIIPKSSFFSES